MSIKVAFGPKNGVDAAILNDKIPMGCLIVTKSDSSESEFMFYDTSGAMRQIAPTTKFQSVEEYDQYVLDNDSSGRAKSVLTGRIISVLEDGVYNAYIVQEDGSRLTLEEEEFISSMGGEFCFDENHSLTILEIEMDKIVGLSTALNKRVKYEELDLRLDELSRVELVKIGEETLVQDPEDRSVTIPLATATRLGVVVGTTKVNGVTVNDDGSMAVNAININKLVQTEGDSIVLNCGNAVW